jgi:hypothetical protein
MLLAISKIFETAIEKQRSEHFLNIFNNFLAAFRSGYGCQSSNHETKAERIQVELKNITLLKSLCT